MGRGYSKYDSRKTTDEYDDEREMGKSDVRLRDVGVAGENESREYILRGDGRVVRGSSVVRASNGGEEREKKVGNVIEKSVDYTVSHEGRGDTSRY